MSWRGRSTLPYVTAGLGRLSGIPREMQAGIPHEKGRERRQILQGDDTGVWNNFIFIQSFRGGARVHKLEFPCPVPSPCAHQVLPLSHDHSQTHTDVLHQHCIFPPKHLLQQSLGPCSTSVSGDFISSNSYKSNVTLSTSLPFPGMLLL